MFRVNRRVPLSNQTLQHQVTTALAELQRARVQQHSGREAWFEDQMNAALDVLCERYRGSY